MASVIYAVMSHRAPSQVARLIDRLTDGSPRARVILHHDGPDAGEVLARAGHPDRVELLQPTIHARWGGPELVEIMLALFRRARELGHPDWIVLLSGQDYPLLPVAEIEDALGGEDSDGVISISARFAHAPLLRPPPRMQRRYWCAYATLPKLPLAPGLRRRAEGAAWRIAEAQGLVDFWRTPAAQPNWVGLRRRAPFSEVYPCWRGSQWMSLRASAVDRLLAEVEARPGLERYFRRTAVPDEAYLQTLLMNDPRLRLRTETNRFARWTGEAPSHPDTLTIGDLPALKASDKLFARKFDVDVDSEILDALDELHA
jgi:hypothetical protein